MKRLNLRGTAALVSSSLLLAGCAANRVPLDYVATVTAIQGSRAWVEPGAGGPVQAATVGRRIHVGDRFFTGAGTRMALSFARGGSVELDENTDPGLLQELECLVISLFHRGRLFVDATDVCVESLGSKS